jgi:agmatine deiminase
VTEQFFQLNKNLLGLNNYHIISNFEKRSIQHIDCFMKVLDEERILVSEPPADHPEYAIYQNIVDNELAKLKTPYDRPYEIIRIKTDRYSKDRLAAYTNSLILNRTIYVPLYQISQDSIALERWQEVMPGYKVKGFYFQLANEPLVDENVKDHYKLYGWNSGDALHCRTRAVWDPQMIFITTKRIEKIVDSKHKNQVYATIIDYSGKGLDLKKTMLFWRVSGQKGWNQIALKQTDAVDHFSVEIPFHKSGCTIEYYISAVSKSGQNETAPRTAPGGLFNFFIQ